MAVLLRFAALALLDVRLMLADRGVPAAAGVLPAMVVAVLAAVAIVTEERPWLRRATLAFVAVDYAAWNLHAFGAWDPDPMWFDAPIARAVQLAVLLVFCETRLWRGSMFLGVLLVILLLVHAYPALVLETDDADRRANWLFFAFVLLVANAVVRLHQEDEKVTSTDARPPRARIHRRSSAAC